MSSSQLEFICTRKIYDTSNQKPLRSGVSFFAPEFSCIGMILYMILSSLLTLLKINLSFLDFFIKQFITAIANIRFEIYLRFIWIQTYRIFYFSGRLSARHHTLSSWCRIFSGRSGSREIRILLISNFLFIVVIMISIVL